MAFFWYLTIWIDSWGHDSINNSKQKRIENCFFCESMWIPTKLWLWWAYYWISFVMQHSVGVLSFQHITSMCSACLEVTSHATLFPLSQKHLSVHTGSKVKQVRATFSMVCSSVRPACTQHRTTGLTLLYSNVSTTWHKLVDLHGWP